MIINPYRFASDAVNFYESTTGLIVAQVHYYDDGGAIIDNVEYTSIVNSDIEGSSLLDDIVDVYDRTIGFIVDQTVYYDNGVASDSVVYETI